MTQFESHKDEIKNAGSQLVFVAAQKRHGLWRPEKALAKKPTSFPFLLDEDRSVTKSYGLYHPFGMDALNIARPATLIIDRDGHVRYIYRGENQLDRAPIETVMSVLKES